MSLFIPSSVNLTREQLTAISGKPNDGKPSEMAITKNVRVSLPITDNIARFDNMVLTPLADSELRPLAGTNYIFKDGILHFDTFAIYFEGNPAKSVVFMHTLSRDDDVSLTYYSNFRLPSAYLPCPLGTKAGDKWTNGFGEATINVDTKEVEDIRVYNNSLWNAEIKSNIIKEEGRSLTVTCVMANGGVCFGGIIK
jgi:hypothetical protein